MSSQESPGLALPAKYGAAQSAATGCSGTLARHGLIGDDKDGNLMGVWGTEDERGLVPRFCASKCS
jgi:hypothetical protein